MFNSCLDITTDLITKVADPNNIPNTTTFSHTERHPKYKFSFPVLVGLKTVFNS